MKIYAKEQASKPTPRRADIHPSGKDSPFLSLASSQKATATTKELSNLRNTYATGYIPVALDMKTLPLQHGPSQPLTYSSSTIKTDSPAESEAVEFLERLDL